MAGSSEPKLPGTVESPLPGFLSLPVEILVSIFRHVARGDLKQLRLSCKFLCLITEPILFHTIVVVPHLDCLKALVSLSEHPTISKCVQIVFYDNRWGDFASWLWETPLKHDIFGQNATPTALTRVLQPSPLLEQLSSGALRKDSTDVEIAYLSRAFSMLPSLSGLGCLEWPASDLTNSEPVPAFYTRFVKLGQFEGPRWDCLGYQEPTQGSWGVLSVLPAMFAARVSVPDLRIDDVEWYDMFQSHHRLQTFRAVLSPVRRLKITTHVDSTILDAVGAGPRVGSIMACFSSLQDLDLEFQLGNFHRGVPEGLGNEHAIAVPPLSLPTFTELFPKEIYFPRLERLALSDFLVNEVDLISFLTRHAETLSVLRLGNGNLDPGAEAGAEACWVRVIRRLQSDLHLQTMLFSRYLGNFDSQNWHILESGIHGAPGCLKRRAEDFVVYGGTCPLEDAAVGVLQGYGRKSPARFNGDDSWVIGRGRREPVSEIHGSDD
jgi:hypothetical protein